MQVHNHLLSPLHGLKMYIATYVITNIYVYSHIAMQARESQLSNHIIVY